MTQVNVSTKQKQTLVVTKGAGIGGGMGWDIGVIRCKLLCIEWIKSKALLPSTEDDIQYLMINHSGKKYFLKECI